MQKGSYVVIFKEVISKMVISLLFIKYQLQYEKHLQSFAIKSRIK